MTTGIDPSYYTGVANSLVVSTKPERSCRSSINAKTDDSIRTRPSREGKPIRTFSPEANMGTTPSGSVIYDPKSLLKDLSGVGSAERMTQEMPEVTLPYKNSQSTKGFVVIIDEPIVSTFEIIV